jgi:hypothetical protein
LKEQLMLGVVEGANSEIVAGRNNEARRKLERLDADAAEFVSEINRNESSLKAVTASLIVAGVQMAAIMEADYDAWDKFAEPFGVRVKGRDHEYRQIAGVLFRKRDGQPTTVRSQISRCGAAICAAYQLSKKVTDLAELKAEVVKAGCVDGLSRRRKEQLRHERNTNTTPAAEPAKAGELTFSIPDRPTPVVLMPDGSISRVPHELALMVLEQMGIAS